MSVPRFFGFNPPFFGGSQNILSRQEDERLIRNDMLQLLLTAPGERVMRPNFGTIIRSSLFEPMDTLQIDALKANIRAQIVKFESRVLVSDIVITQDIEGNTITIKIFGTFVLDRFGQITTSLPQDVDLIVELDLPVGGV